MKRGAGASPGAIPDEMGEAWARYRALLEKVDDFWDRAVAAQPEAFACRARCAACCSPGLTVLPVEAAAIRAQLATLDDSVRARLLSRPEGRGPDGSCALLLDGLCSVYPARPVICRTHGLALRFEDRIEDRIDHCPLCFAEQAPLPEGVLSLETLNTLLVLVNRHWLAAQGLPEDSPREALADLADLVGQGPPPGGN